MQHKYIRDILDRTKMTEAKPVNSPMTTTTFFSMNDGIASVDPEEFRKIIVLLQYLFITRPDIYLWDKQACTIHA